jgi:hypothetical protein|tara:strand:- start:733 stop:1203 length:471 start_codon:yes stop_codon:yes gene_type:complete
MAMAKVHRWEDFARAAPEIATAGLRLLALNEVAFLATASGTGRPRLHPFVPRVLQQRLVAFIMDSSPKAKDLELRRQYAAHTLPGSEDEEFFVSGEAWTCNDETAFRSYVAKEMGFATGVDEHHILFEFAIDRALWTQWLDFGTAKHRPSYVRWKA